MPRLLGDFREYFVGVGVFSGFFLGVDQLVIEHDFVDTTTGGDQGYLSNGFVVVSQDEFRQTDGFREVASRGAVFDGDSSLVSHGDSFIIAAYRPHGYTMRPFLAYHHRSVNPPRRWHAG